MLSTDWAMPIARDKGYYSTSSLGTHGLPAEVKQALNLDHIDDLMKRLKWSSFPPNLQDWTEAWTEFKAA
jgi:hypothetical protein